MGSCNPGSGALIQLAAVGKQNTFLYGRCSPFRKAYRRATRFAQWTEDVTMQYVPGRRTQIEIPKSGDILGDMYLEVRIPAISGIPPDLLGQMSWSKCLGYTLLRRVRLLLNDQEIHNIERLWYDLYDLLNAREGHAQGLRSMVGREPLPLTSSHLLYIPLRFLTCRPGVSRAPLPLQALSNANLKLDIEWERPEVLAADAIQYIQGHIQVREQTIAQKNVEVDGYLFQISRLEIQDPGYEAALQELYAQIDVARRAKNEIQTEINQFLAYQNILKQDPGISVTVLTDYIEIEDPEKSNVLKGVRLAFESVIDSDATNYFIDSEGNVQDTPTVQVNLGNVRYPVKALIWVAYTESGPLFTYLQQPVTQAFVTFNKQERFAPRDSGYFELYQQYKHTRRCSTGPPSVYSFALDASSRLNWGDRKSVV